MLRLPCECYECLRMLTNGLANVTNVLVWMMRMSYQRCHCLAIFLWMMGIFDDEAVIWIKTEWIWRWQTFTRNGKRRTLQSPCKCLTNVANASECFTNVTNGIWMLTKIDIEWQHSQHPLNFRRRFLMLLSHIGEYASECAYEWKDLTFAQNSLRLPSICKRL